MLSSPILSLPIWSWPTLAIVMPAIDPVIVQVGPVAIRWYALAYVAGLLIGWWLMRRLIEADRLWPAGQRRPTVLELDDLLVYAAVGVVVGGRAGHVLESGHRHVYLGPCVAGNRR